MGARRLVLRNTDASFFPAIIILCSPSHLHERRLIVRRGLEMQSYLKLDHAHHRLYSTSLIMMFHLISRSSFNQAVHAATSIRAKLYKTDEEPASMALYQHRFWLVQET